MKLNLPTVIIENREFKHRHWEFELWLVFAILLLWSFWAYADERKERMKWERVVMECLNERPFVVKVDREIGVLCFRDQKAIGEK